MFLAVEPVLRCRVALCWHRCICWDLSRCQTVIFASFQSGNCKWKCIWELASIWIKKSVSCTGHVMARAVTYRGKTPCAFICRLSWSLLYTVYIAIMASLLTLITIRGVVHEHNFFEIYFFYFFYGIASVSLLLCSSMMHEFFPFLVKTSKTQRLQSTLGLGVTGESNKNFSSTGFYCYNL